MFLPKRPTQPGPFFDWLRMVVDALPPLRIIESATIKPRFTPKGTYLDAKVNPSGSNVVDEFIIRPDVAGEEAVEEDWFWAKKYHRNADDSEEIGETSYKIAKPHYLRHNVIEGVTYPSTGNRTLEIDGFTHDEEIVPQYAEDQIIHAVRLPRLTIDDEEEANDVQWLEISPARAWLDIRREFEICVNDQPKRVMIRASQFE